MRYSLANSLVIRTPEGIAFSLMLAGPISRFLAWGVDVACIVLGCRLALVTIGMFGVFSAGLAAAMTTVAIFLIPIAYAIVLEWFWRGQTVGKWLLRLRVMDERALRLQFSQIVMRNLLRFVDFLPVFYLVGGIACLASRRCQRLGDFAANTIVVRHLPALEPELDTVLTGKYSSFRDYPHLEARLRQRISPDEARIALQALLRRDQLEPSARIELFRELADHFRSLVTFPEEAAVGLTDEQYVRNVVDALFRKQSGPHLPKPAEEAGDKGK